MCESQINASFCIIIINPCVLIICAFKKPLQPLKLDTQFCYLPKSAGLSTLLCKPILCLQDVTLSFSLDCCLLIIFVSEQFEPSDVVKCWIPAKKWSSIDLSLLLYHQQPLVGFFLTVLLLYFFMKWFHLKMLWNQTQK